MALQEQNFVLGNSLTNLVKKWPRIQMDQATTNEALSMFGILLETKDWISILATLLSTYAVKGIKEIIRIN